MRGIQAEESGSGVTVGMRGEFDAYSLPDMRRTLDRACAFGKPVVVDLSGVTFLDLRSARELAVQSVIQAHQLAFENPSPGVLASVRDLGIFGGSRTRTGREEPSVFSEA